jgi:hypothetical protein
MNWTETSASWGRSGRTRMNSPLNAVARRSAWLVACCVELSLKEGVLGKERRRPYFTQLNELRGRLDAYSIQGTNFSNRKEVQCTQRYLPKYLIAR